jgi:hypothetical protein
MWTGYGGNNDGDGDGDGDDDGKINHSQKPYVCADHLVFIKQISTSEKSATLA